MRKSGQKKRSLRTKHAKAPQRVWMILCINSHTVMRCRSSPSGIGRAEAFLRKKIFRVK